MTSSSNRGLLTLRDAAPVGITNRGGASEFLLLGDHAGNLVPEQLGDLGLGAQALARHIALDIGVSQLGQRLSRTLDAPFIEQRYSRLVIDCNRTPGRDDSIAECSDGTSVPGNTAISRSDARQRAEEIFVPYHRAIADLISERKAAGRPTVIIALHSFTPRLRGFDRPWQIGVLHSGGNTDFALAMLKALRKVAELVVGDNEPYRMDETDFTVPHHAFSGALPYAECEIRQSELSAADGVIHMASILSEAMRKARTACPF